MRGSSEEVAVSVEGRDRDDAGLGRVTTSAPCNYVELVMEQLRKESASL